MSKQPPTAYSASAEGPCPTVIQIVGRPGTGSSPSTIAPPDQLQLVEAPSNFIAGRPRAAFLFWLFSDFRCGVPLFIVILVIYKYKNRLK